jgi:hypothetical protein
VKGADRRLWRLTGHVCRHCLGRVLVTDNDDGTESARCSNCGTEAEGDHRSICACGLKLRNGKSAGLRCAVNPNRTAELPSEIVAVSA